MIVLPANVSVAPSARVPRPASESVAEPPPVALTFTTEEPRTRFRLPTSIVFKRSARLVQMKAPPARLIGAAAGSRFVTAWRPVSSQVKTLLRTVSEEAFWNVPRSTSRVLPPVTVAEPVKVFAAAKE